MSRWLSWLTVVGDRNCVVIAFSPFLDTVMAINTQLFRLCDYLS